MELAILDFESQEIRIVGTKECPEFVAVDVCRVLGVSNPSDTIKQFPPTEKGIDSIYTLGGSQEMLTVNESGLYRLIFKSRKPNAEQFQYKIFHEVLPCIRKHGCWPAPMVEVNDKAIIQVDAQQLCVQLGETFRQAVFPIEEKVDRVETKVDCLDHRVSLIERRKRIPQKVKQRHVYIVWKAYTGMCPCCRKVAIVDVTTGGKLSNCQFDHWVRSSETSVGKTWAVCDSCNQNLNDSDYKTKKSPQFEAYQECRREFDNWLDGPMLPGME